MHNLAMTRRYRKSRRDPGLIDIAASSDEARPAVWSREVINRMEWKRFEDLCCEFYRAKGLRAETMRLGADV